MNTSKIALYTTPDKNINISAEDAIFSMFDHTDDNGILYIPEWPRENNRDDKERFYKCLMNWDELYRDLAIGYYQLLYNRLKEIAEKWDAISSGSAAEILPEKLFEVWDTYIRDFETGNINTERIADISDRYEIIFLVDHIKNKLSANAELSKDELSFYSEYKDTSVSEEENALYAEYKDAIYADAKKRVGDNIAAYDVVIRARRLCKLMSLGAPAVIIENEAVLLAQAIVIHSYCKDMETVDNVE